MREVATTVPPWRWEADPGAEAVRMLLEQEAESRGGLHPILADLMLLERLQGRRTPPFSLEGRPGVLILDHAPGWTDVTRSALQQVLRWCPIHQVCAPGSSRLGLHGEVIVDQPAIKERSELPGWIPEHDVTRVPTLSEGMPPRGRIHILHVQGVTSITDATLDLATTMMGRGHQPLFLEADAERRRTIGSAMGPIPSEIQPEPPRRAHPIRSGRPPVHRHRTGRMVPRADPTIPSALTDLVEGAALGTSASSEPIVVV